MVVTKKNAQITPASQTVHAFEALVPWRAHWVVALNKPAGLICATRDAAQPTIMSLIDDDLWRKGLAPVGRLDKDTTGLLLLTNDGALSHRLTHPKRHVAKRYRVWWEGALERPVERLAQGITLKDGAACRPAALAIVQASDVGGEGLLTLREGKYHQVKRMIAACGGHVTRLHREAIGGLDLPADLAGGQARLLEEAELQAIFGAEA